MKQLLPLVERTATMKCKLGLYNHGGWGGEPENLVAVCKALREQHKADHVGIVYNLHHGHDHIHDFAKALAAMQPYLLCLNLNGMTTDGDKKGRRSCRWAPASTMWPCSRSFAIPGTPGRSASSATPMTTSSSGFRTTSTASTGCCRN